MKKREKKREEGRDGGWKGGKKGGILLFFFFEKFWLQRIVEQKVHSFHVSSLLKQFTPFLTSPNPLQYSCLENSMDARAWWATVYEVAKD